MPIVCSCILEDRSSTPCSLTEILYSYTSKNSTTHRPKEWDQTKTELLKLPNHITSWKFSHQVLENTTKSTNNTTHIYRVHEENDLFAHTIAHNLNQPLFALLIRFRNSSLVCGGLQLCQIFRFSHILFPFYSYGAWGRHSSQVFCFFSQVFFQFRVMGPRLGLRGSK